MDSMEFNKIAGAVLSALLVAFGSSTLVHELTASHGDHDPAYRLVAEDAMGDGGTEAADAEPEEEEVPMYEQVKPLLASATVDAGKSVYGKCRACHTVNEGGRNGVGPNLWGIVGRNVGSDDAFKYSGAMSERGGVWDVEALAGFLHQPKEWLPGTKMGFGGLRKADDVANVISYLNSLSDEPADLAALAN